MTTRGALFAAPQVRTGVCRPTRDGAQFLTFLKLR